MSYLKINGNAHHYNVSISSFTTQHGYRAVRFDGDAIPDTDKGFKYYDDDNNLIADLSEFTNIYRPNEYSIEPDTFNLPTGSSQPLPPSSIDKINSRISTLSSQVSSITPYTFYKEVGIDETEVEFDLVRNGNISAWLSTEDAQIPCDFEVIDNKIRVSFDALTEVATVYISIQ